MAAMHQADQRAEAPLQLGEAVLRGGQVDVLGFLDQRADPIDPAALGERAADRLDHLAVALVRNGAGIDRLAPGRLLAQLGNIHVAEKGQHQCARDRGRGHHQNVDRFALAGERQALVHPEAVLLVDDREREIAERDVVLEHRMGADQDMDVAEGEPIEDGGALGARARGR